MDKPKQFLTNFEKAGIPYTLHTPLAPFTTWKIGGPADILATITEKSKLVLAINVAKEANVPFTILGSGSNVLISDDGLRGLVIINRIETISIESENITHSVVTEADKIQARLNQIDKQDYYSFDDIDYDESDSPSIYVTVSSGFYLPKLINATITRGATGLQWFAGIPGTIGGAVYNNIHGGSHFISEFVEELTVLDEKGSIKTLTKDDLDFEYDSSRFHKTKEIILDIKLRLYKGNKQKALNAAIAWAQKKRLQPFNSAGCCFKNITAMEMEKLHLLSSSWGYIIDKILSLKGIKAGGAMISTRHAAFIENTGNAKASDVLDLFDLIYSSSKQKLGITPKTEIFMLGFPLEITEKYIK